MSWWWPFGAKWVPSPTCITLLHGYTPTSWADAKPRLIAVLGPAPSPTIWGGILGYIETNDPNLFLELWLLDCAASGVLWGDPTHTVSWQIATGAKAGNPIDIAICQALNLLSPNHCAQTLATER